MNTRDHDLEELNRMYYRATNVAERKAILRSMYQIRHESKRTRAMRESLIRATRSSDHPEIKDIHDYISKKTEYHNND